MTLLYRFVSRLFGRAAAHEAVATRMRVYASVDAVWNQLRFYEDIPRRPGFLLRTLLPEPIRSHGDKTRVGGIVYCTYKNGATLAKRITFVEPPRQLQFEVTAQALGIEDCILTIGGSYQLREVQDGTELLLTTSYHAYLHPRELWRPVEARLVNQLHGHILDGLRASLPSRSGAQHVISASPARSHMEFR
jgi:hypothetical protein